MPTATRRRPGKKAPTLLDVIAEHQKTQRRKRRTPARILIRRLVNKKTRGSTLLALALVGVGGVVLASRYLPLGAEALSVAVCAALAGFLLLCEAWPELARWAFQNRRMLTPFVALALMTVPEVAVYLWPRLALMVALAGLVFTAYAHLNLWLRRLDHSHAAGYIPRAWLPMAYLATGWTVLAARFGLSTTTLGVLLLAWLTWAGWFWFENRTRTSHQLPLAKRWGETIANPDYEHIDSGKKLIGSKLVNVRAVPGGAAARIVLPAGQMGSKIDGLVEVIASIYGALVTDVTIDEPTGPGAAASMRDMFVLPKSPLRKPHHWKGSDLDYTTWTSTIGSYIDGERVKYVWCVPGSGPWHDLIAGTTRAGKSRFLDQLLTTSRQAKGYMVDWVIDPQNGQSLPDWVDEVDKFASTADEGLVLLREARAEMYARNKVFGAMEYTDKRGRTRRGMKGFTPSLKYPQINLTIDEAHAVLANPDAAVVLAEMAKMASKCGIKVRLVVHLPLLSELGNSSVLRDMVASGNVIVLRTASRITGQVAFQGALPVDPVTIPRLMPDGTSSAGLGFALGADARRAPMRLDWVEEPLDLIQGIPIHHLPARADSDVIEGEVISDVPTEPEAPVEGVVVRGPGGITCADRVIQIVKKEANRAADPHARVSRSDVGALLVKTWGLQQITKTIKGLCADPDKPVWSDDERQTLYYKEPA
jgi:hypothetical protein